MVNISRIGSYTLSFIYCNKLGGEANLANIYFNNNLLGSVNTYSENWTLYSTTFNVNASGNLLLLFDFPMSSNTKYFNMTNVSLVFNNPSTQVIPNKYLTQLNANSHVFKKMYINSNSKKYRKHSM